MKQITSLLILISCMINVLTVHAQQPDGNSVRPPALTRPIPNPYNNNTINYIRTYEPSVSVRDPATIVGNNNVRQIKQNSYYVDGLGRELQTVSKAAGPEGKDIVAPIIYDAFGREQVKYLPYVSQDSDGKFKTNPFVAQATFMNNYYAGEHVYYQETEFEASPLNRVIETYAPGNSWARGSQNGAKPITYEYLTNKTDDSVVIWDILPDNAIPYRVGIYLAGKLFKNAIKDEHGKSIIEFKDKEGRVILKKVQIQNSVVDGHTGWLCTYYVYDDLNNLLMVITPKAVESLLSNSWQFVSGVADELCFRYKYDGRRRMVEKRIPGVTMPTEMVYDVRDRLVCSRDGNLAARGKWLVTFYDGLNRPTMTALYESRDSREILQNTMNTSTSTSFISYDFPVSAEIVISQHDGRAKYQASQQITFTGNFDSDITEMDAEIVPNGKTGTTTLTVSNPLPNLDNSKIEPLAYNFFDTYEYAGAHGLKIAYLEKLQSADPARETVAMASNMTIGLLTGTKVRILGTSQWLTTTSFYDDKGRVIQSISDNVNGNQEVISKLYDFNGRILSTYQYHNNAKGVPTTSLGILTILDYDDVGRLISVKKGINDRPLKTIVTNEYDAIGQLKIKTLGNNLESLEYSYNIRGWLKGINKSYLTDEKSHYFGTELHYDYGYSANQFNGNIAGITWRGKGDGQSRSYGYSYDAAKRLMKADFTEKNGNNWVVGNVDFSMKMGDGLTSSSAYDANGNIKAMSQNGLKTISSSLIDQLTYEYQTNSNKLKSVTDAVNDPTSILGDFKEVKGASSNDYAYDSNGNLVQDDNKDIPAGGIIYNHLNLPESITINEKGIISYLYDAAGVKLRKTVIENTNNQTRKTVTEYIGGIVYQNDTLQFLTHEEGRARWVNEEPVFDYFIKDHLGSTRMVLTEQKASGTYAATMESKNSLKENALFGNIEATRTPKPVGYPMSQSNNEFVAKLSAKSGNKKIGPSLVLKVMAGDTIQLNVEAFYKSQGPNNNNNVLASADDMMSDLLATFGAGTQQSSVHAGGQPVFNNPFLSNFYANDYQRLKERDQSSNQPNVPKAYLNFVLFDEQFSLVPINSGVRQVKEQPDQLQQLTLDKTAVSKNGYLYVYTSNESQQDVFFDNIILSMNAGPVLEETHYYPFGLVQYGISYKAAGGLENKLQKFNGAELNKAFDLNLYEFYYRTYDPQIGRWMGLDPKPTESLSLYGAFGNNPVKNVDFLGDTTTYYDLETGAQLATINNRGARQRVKVNGGLYTMLTSKLSDNTSEAVHTNQGVADAFVSVFNGILDKLESNGLAEKAGYGKDVISRETGELSLSFDGTANTNNTREANGSLNVISHFDNGSTLTTASYTAIGGPHGNGSPENGAYTANNLRSRRDNPGMIRDGVGFSMDLNPSFETGRALLRIHPDGNRPGTLGCIGLQVDGTQLNNFRNTINTYLQTHPSINTNINITNNPNNNGRGGRVNINGIRE